jgi:hypothetical protein
VGPSTKGLDGENGGIKMGYQVSMIIKTYENTMS